MPLAAILGLIAFAGVLTMAFLLFLSWDTRRLNRERAEFEAENKRVHEAAERALRAARRDRDTIH